MSPSGSLLAGDALWRSDVAGAGRVVYLPTMGRVVVPYEHAGDGWWCVVVVDPSGLYAPGAMVRVTDGQILTGLAVPLADPVAELPADAFARVWLAQVQASGGPSRIVVARALAGPLRLPNLRIVVVDASDRRRLSNAAHIRHPVIITRTLARLVEDGLLQPMPRPPMAQAYRLVLRYTPWNTADAPAPVSVRRAVPEGDE
jgi:hypothetical protein